MKRILIAGVAGAIVLFVWSSISWMIIPWHRMEKLPAEASIAQSFRDANVERGMYWLPGKDLSIPCISRRRVSSVFERFAIREYPARPIPPARAPTAASTDVSRPRAR